MAKLLTYGDIVPVDPPGGPCYPLSTLVPKLLSLSAGIKTKSGIGVSTTTAGKLIFETRADDYLEEFNETVGEVGYGICGIGNRNQLLMLGVGGVTGEPIHNCFCVVTRAEGTNAIIRMECQVYPITGSGELTFSVLSADGPLAVLIYFGTSVPSGWEAFGYVAEYSYPESGTITRRGYNSFPANSLIPSTEGNIMYELRDGSYC